jgi:hypothetical protein
MLDLLSCNDITQHFPNGNTITNISVSHAARHISVKCIPMLLSYSFLHIIVCNTCCISQNNLKGTNNKIWEWPRITISRLQCVLAPKNVKLKIYSTPVLLSFLIWVWNVLFHIMGIQAKPNVRKSYCHVIDEVWIGNRIYWRTHDYTLQITVTHTPVSTVLFSLSLFGGNFQWRTFPFLWFPERSPASATSFSQQQLATTEPQKSSN